MQQYQASPSRSKTSCPSAHSVPPHRANKHALPPYSSIRVSMSHAGHLPLKNNNESSLCIRPSATVPPRISKKMSQELMHSRLLASELKRITDPSQNSLKRDLLDIHIRNNALKKTKKKKKSVHPIYEQEVHLEEKLPINALTSIAAKIDLGSYTKDYIRMSKEYKTMEKYRVYPTKKDTCHHPACVHCSRRKVQKVFFPCEHGTCNICLHKQPPKQCPLCNEIIRVVLDRTGNEYEEYWKWVEEVGFLPKFHVVLS